MSQSSPEPTATATASAERSGKGPQIRREVSHPQGRPVQDKFYLPAVLKGMWHTFWKHMLRPEKTFTVNYPDVKRPVRRGYRGEHRLKKDEQGREKCVACFMCSTACPANCIRIVAEPAPWNDRDKHPKIFEIDLLECIYCGMCEEACPCDAIELTEVYNVVSQTREEKIYDKERLLSN